MPSMITPDQMREEALKRGYFVATENRPYTPSYEPTPTSRQEGGRKFYCYFNDFNEATYIDPEADGSWPFRDHAHMCELLDKYKATPTTPEDD